MQSSIDNITFNNNLGQLIDKIESAEPSLQDVSSASETTPITEMNDRSLQLAILRSLQNLNANVAGLTNEMSAMKEELSAYKNIAQNCESKITSLESENKRLLHKIEDMERSMQSNTLILSGPNIKCSDLHSPVQLRDLSIRNLKETYNYNLRNEDVFDCKKLNSKDASNSKLLLTLHSPFTKRDLINKVIQTDKRKGVKVNVNEFLSPINSELLYKIRGLRKNNKQKIYSCFSRDGRVFCKLKKEGRPILIRKAADINDIARKLNSPNNEDPSTSNLAESAQSETDSDHYNQSQLRRSDRQVKNKYRQITRVETPINSNFTL